MIKFRSMIDPPNSYLSIKQASDGIYKDKGSTKSVSDILIEEKLAYRYGGKTKMTDEMIKNELNIITCAT